MSNAEKSKVMKTVKAVMPRSEELKKILRTQYENEYQDYLQILEIHRIREQEKAEELRKLKLQQEGETLRKEISKYHDDKMKSLQMQRDLEVAMWTQMKLNQEESEQIQQPKPTTSPHSSIPSQAPKIPDRATKPSSNNSLYSGSGGLRKLVVPNMLMAKFMSIAERNTSSNIETCGVLTGKLAHNRFQITHLLIPKQSGTSDSCTTTGEESIFDYQEKHDLITLGWIHTHPSQTAFLSSVDLHTQLSYQLMLPEAIAIVIAPKYNQTGFYSLTPDHGLDLIANCRESGFHPHAKDPPLFAELDHVQLDDKSDVTIVDLRN